MSVRSVQAITYDPPRKAGQAAFSVEGQDSAQDFLKLLVAQITNQDPDRPLSATDMITQFAQVTGALNLNNLQQAAQVFQRVQTAGTLLNQRVVVYDAILRRDIEGVVKGIDFSESMPAINVDGVRYGLDAVRALGDS